MKPLITFILLSFYLSTITAQAPNLAGNWTIVSENNIATSCCVPSGIAITAINSGNNTYEASFTFPSNYVSTNTYCISSDIVGNFVADFHLVGTATDIVNSAVTISTFANSADTINIDVASTSSGIQDATVGLSPADTVCLYSITKIGVKLAISSVFGIISLVIINLW